MTERVRKFILALLVPIEPYLYVNTGGCKCNDIGMRGIYETERNKSQAEKTTKSMKALLEKNN